MMMLLAPMNVKHMKPGTQVRVSMLGTLLRQIISVVPLHAKDEKQRETELTFNISRHTCLFLTQRVCWHSEKTHDTTPNIEL